VVIGRCVGVIGRLFLLDRQLKCRASVLRVKGKRPAELSPGASRPCSVWWSLTESAVAVFVLHEIAQRSAPGPTRVSPVSRVRHSSGLPVTNVKRSETAESHRSFPCQTSLNTVEKCVYKNGHGTLRLPGRGRSTIDDIAFKHKEMSFREIPLGTGSQFPMNLPRK